MKDLWGSVFQALKFSSLSPTSQIPAECWWPGLGLQLRRQRPLGWGRGEEQKVKGNQLPSSGLYPADCGKCGSCDSPHLITCLRRKSK